MSKTFGEFLKKLRVSVKPKKVSQQQLGDVINSTRQYIDAIEKNKGKTPPPRYQLLIKLANRLNLTTTQLNRFLWMAFKERIHSNWELYSYLHKNDSQFLQSNSFNSSLVYAIRLSINNSPLSQEKQAEVTQHFNTVCSNYELISINVTETEVTVIIGIDLKDTIAIIIDELKECNVNWNDDVKVQTIGNIPAEWSQFTISKTVGTKTTTAVK